MKVASFAKATAILGAAAFFVASAGIAQAQVTKDDGKCRSAIQKNVGKLHATASKAIVGCWKSVLGGKIGFTNCNDSATADTKGKIAKAAAKVTGTTSGAKAKCVDATHAAALAEYQDCPSPGTSGAGLTTFPQVGTCLVGVAEGMADNMHRVALNPGPAEISSILGSANVKQIGKCGNTILKNFNKLLATVGKEEGGYQAKVLDKAGTNPYDYGAAGQDPKSKISGVIGKMNAAITKDCGPLSQNDFSLLRTCGNEANVGTCLTEIAKNGASGVTAVSFEMPGVCPSSVTVRARTRQSNGGAASATKLDAGWTGFGMNAELLTFTGDVNLACTDGTCSNCAVTVGCANGNCRCSNNVTQVCSTPFVQSTCGAGNTCQALFGSPLPLNASNTPTCLTTQITAELTGSADIGTGASNTQVTSATKVHSGIGGTKPCPICTGANVCSDGPRAGLACSPNGVSPVFGTTSYDCPPDPVSNVSGGGLKIKLLFSDSPPALASNVACTYAGGASGQNCPCAVCTGDTSVPCNGNGDCSGVGGTCTSIGAGVHTQPNDCTATGASCVLDAAGNGECSDKSAMFCDSFLNPDGSPVISCLGDGDCIGAGAGLCTLSKALPCMMNADASLPIPGTFGGQEGAVLGGAFCAPPTANPGINGAAGTPGPVRAAIAWEFDGLCSDGITPYTLGGTGCP